MNLRSTLSDVFHERTNFDFVGNKRRWFALSGALMGIGVIALVANGLNLGIDFEGGTSWQVKVADNVDLSSDDVRQVVSDAGLDDPEIAILNGDSARVQAARVTSNGQKKITEALANYAGVDTEDVSLTDVGPTWGDEVSSKAFKALFFFFVAIALYLSLRFELKMAIAAIIAVIHDILISVGAYAITRFEVTPATVIAFLTILGFSLYDTVVVFDKIRENGAALTAGGRATYSDMANRSMNEVLMRSLNTSIVASLPVFSLLIVGTYVFDAITLKDFALALSIGLATGAYSSIFVATPLLAIMKEREPRYVALRQRLAKAPAAGKTGAPAQTLAAATAGGRGGEGRVTDESGGSPAGNGDGDGDEQGAPAVAHRPPPRRTGGPAPRPRQKRRKK